MNDKNFKITLSVSASPEKAFAAISNIKGWWATNASGSIDGLNSLLTVRFGKTFATIKVTEYISGQRMRWKMVDSSLPLFNDPSQWNGTTLVWEVTADKDKTSIRMEHAGLTQLKECYTDCEKGWTFYVGQSLKNLIENGDGMPGTGIFSYINADNFRYEGLLYFKNDSLPDYPDGSMYIDAKSTNGENVTSAYSIGNYSKNTFNPSTLKGDYFMILDDKSLVDNAPIVQIIKTALLMQ